MSEEEGERQHGKCVCTHPESIFLRAPWDIVVLYRVCCLVQFVKHNPNLLPESGKEMLRTAAAFGRYAHVQYLMDHGVDVRAPESGMPSALICAVPNIAMMTFLLRAGAPLHYSYTAPYGSKEESALTHAMEKRSRPAIHFLLDRGARLPAPMRRDDDPHMWALMEQRRRCGRVAATLYGILRVRYRVAAQGFPQGYQLERAVASRIAAYVWLHRADTMRPEDLDRADRAAAKIARPRRRRDH